MSGSSSAGILPAVATQATQARWYGNQLNRPRTAALLTLLGAVVIVIARWRTWARGNISAFILVGQTFSHPQQLPPGLALTSGDGYDGQFYYRLALDPANMHTTAYGITVDTSYRFMRDGYPALTWLLSFGQQSVVPVMLVVVNAAAIAAIGYFGAIAAQRSGRHALWGLLLAGFFGLITSLSRDTAEPVAAACLLAGVIALGPDGRGKRRPVLAGLLFGYGSLTRETVIIAPAAFALIRLWAIARRKDRPGREDLAWVIPAAAFAGWQAIVYAATGQFALKADGGQNSTTPFSAPLNAIRWNFSHFSASNFNSIDVWCFEFILFALVVLAALISLRSTTVPVYLRIAFVVYIFEVCLIAPTTWDSRTADMRSFIEVWLLAMGILFGCRWRQLTNPLAWRLPALAAGLVPVALFVVTRRLTGT
jgi:hypothetical protein